MERLINSLVYISTFPLNSWICERITDVSCMFSPAVADGLLSPVWCLLEMFETSSSRSPDVRACAQRGVAVRCRFPPPMEHSSTDPGRWRNRTRRRSWPECEEIWSSSSAGAGTSSCRTAQLGTCRWRSRADAAAGPARCRGSRTCRRSACRALWSWCSCRSSSAGLGSACRSSCWACSSSRPSAAPPRPDPSSWTRRWFLPTWCRTSWSCRTEAPGGTATAGSDQNLKHTHTHTSTILPLELSI